MIIMLTRNQKRKLLESLNCQLNTPNNRNGNTKIHKSNNNIENELENSTLHNSDCDGIMSDSEYESSESDSESINSSSESNTESDKSESFNILKTFDNNLSSVLNGDFFNLFPDEYNLKMIKTKYSIKSIETLNTKLKLLRSNYIINDAEIDKILHKNIPDSIKLKILEKLYLVSNCEILSPDYNYYIKELKELLYYSNSDELIELDTQINNLLNDYKTEYYNYKYKILKSEMSFNNKVIAYKYLKVIENYNDQPSDELSKYKNWLNTLLTIPFNKYHESINNDSKYLIKVRNELDKELAFLDYPKDQILNIIAQLIRNPNSKINAIGLYGNKGIGKTQFVETISKALDRPLVRISLGGNADVQCLKGHNFTYIGSKQGKLIDGLIKSKIMNPIIFFDEIDKISQNQYGADISGFLIHLIDLTTNNKFNGDEYFSGIELDLSRALFIFTYNNPNLVDSILADRLYKIKINNYSKQEKIHITSTHLINNILKEFNLTTNDIVISDDIIKEIINLSDEYGMRDIKNNIHLLVSRLNTLLLSDPDNSIITLKYQSLYPFYNKLPIILQKRHLNILLDSPNTKNNDYFNLYT